MKIAVIAKTRLPIAEPFRGGLEAFTHALCREYLAQGHDIKLYAHSGSDPDLRVKGFYGDENRDSAYFDIFENDEYLSILNDIEQNSFDVVHNNSTHELPVIWGSRAEIPVVTTLHTPPISKLKAAASIYAGAGNLHFIFPSSSFQKTWLPFIGKASKIIHNGVDLQQWPLLREKADYLFWFGRIVFAKGLDIALDAAHELSMPLRFAGPIDDLKYYEEEILPRISANDMYLGHLQQSEIQDNMRGAAAALSAVRWEEPFGLTTVEAMASGVPVAGFDRGAFSEIIDEKSGVVAAQRNVKSLANAALKAIRLDSSDVRSRAEMFSLKNMVHQYINFFKEII